MKKSTFIGNKEHCESLDKINNGRVETTRRRVAHAIKLLNIGSNSFSDSSKSSEISNKIAHAVNLLDAGIEEMNWACEWYDWNSEICLQMDNAVKELGIALSEINDFEENPEEFSLKDVQYRVFDAMVKLAKSLATLTRWFDDEQDVSEI